MCTRTARTLACWVTAVLLTGFAPSPAFAGADGKAVAEGERIFGQYCSGCHGDTGEGSTLKAWFLSIEPRDLTKGIFKLRSTPRGTLPTDEDLHRTITYGILRSAMPQYRRLTGPERDAVVAYIKTLSDRWKAEGPGEPITIPDPPEDLMSKASVARGQEVYTLLQCGSCHGPLGRGDGTLNKNPGGGMSSEGQPPANLRRGIYKSGDTEKGLYRAVMTGLDGSSMHAFGSLFAAGEGKRIGPSDAWHLVAYVLSLRGL
jgi:mono/diheme cytochrome c family protein